MQCNDLKQMKGNLIFVVREGVVLHGSSLRCECRHSLLKSEAKERD